MSWHAWKVKLTVDAVKINVDVAIRETFAVTAAALRNHHGELLGYDFLKIAATSMGVEMATRLGYGRVILEGDSEIVICAINSHSMCSTWRIHNQVVTVHTLLQ